MLKLRANEPYLFELHAAELVNDALMLVMAHAAKLLHVADDSHLVVGIDSLEVVQCRRHACRVGVVGVDDEAVAGCLLKL